MDGMTEYAALTDEQRAQILRDFLCVKQEDYPIVKTEQGYQMLRRDGTPYWRAQK